MKFMPYRICDHVVALQVDGAVPTTLADLRSLTEQAPPGVHIFVHFPWHSLYAVAERIKQLADELGMADRVHLMVNTVGELEGFARTGLPTLHAPASLYVSEHVFDIQRLGKRTDAIYIANFVPVSAMR